MKTKLKRKDMITSDDLAVLERMEDEEDKLKYLKEKGYISSFSVEYDYDEMTCIIHYPDYGMTLGHVFNLWGRPKLLNVVGIVQKYYREKEEKRNERNRRT